MSSNLHHNFIIGNNSSNFCLNFGDKFSLFTLGGGGGGYCSLCDQILIRNLLLVTGIDIHLIKAGGHNRWNVITKMGSIVPPPPNVNSNNNNNHTNNNYNDDNTDLYESVLGISCIIFYPSIQFSWIYLYTDSIFFFFNKYKNPVFKIFQKIIL